MTQNISCIHQHEKAKERRQKIIGKLMYAYELCCPDEVKKENGVTFIYQDKFDRWAAGFPGSMIMSLACLEYFSFVEHLAKTEGINCGCNKGEKIPAAFMTNMESRTIH